MVKDFSIQFLMKNNFM